MGAWATTTTMLSLRYVCALVLCTTSLFIALISADTPVSTRCNNTALLDPPLDPAEWFFLVDRLSVCNTPNGCVSCLNATHTDDTYQLRVVQWGYFFYPHNCWGQPLRTEPTAEPWTTAPTAQTFVRVFTKASCDVSFIPCVFAYREDYCPVCAICPNQTVCAPTNSTCEVTLADLDRERTRASDNETRFVGLAVGVGLFAVGVAIYISYKCGRLHPYKDNDRGITSPRGVTGHPSSVALMFCCILALSLTPVDAGNQTMCNNTAVLGSTSSMDWSILNLVNLQCQDNRNCTICLSEDDQTATAMARQTSVDSWGAFFDENDCWGLRLRETPSSDPWVTAPSKVSFVRSFTKSSCNVSSVKCAFAYQDGYCPTPVPCAVTPADLASEKQKADKREKELLDYSILVGVLCAVATLCIGYGLGRWHASMAHRRHPKPSPAPVMQPLYVVPGSSSSHVNGMQS